MKVLLVLLSALAVAYAYVQQGQHFPGGISLNRDNSSSVVSSGDSCLSTEEGVMSYSAADKRVLLCNGETWKSLTYSDEIASEVSQNTSSLLRVLRSSPESLTSEECLQLCPGICSYEFVVLCDRPVGYWRLNELNGDNSGVAIEYARRGAAHGSYGSSSRLIKGWSNNHVSPASCGYRGIENQGLFFNRAAGGGSADANMEITFPHTSVFSTAFTGSFAIELWINDHTDVAAPGDGTTLPQINWSIFYKLQSGSQNSLWIYRTRQNGNYALITIDAQGDSESLSPAPSLQVGDQQWHHYVYEFNRDTLTKTMYVDGQVYFSGSMNAAYDGINNTDEMTLSRDGSWRGLFSDFAIYNSALGAERVALHFGASQNSCQ